jgi:hypothetical protein
MKCRLLLTTLILAVLATPAPAGIFGKKKEPPKPDPKDRVHELLVIVKMDKDESKRASAAEELRQYDPKAFGDIVPVLIDVLMNDPKPAVRAEAAQSLGKIRPITMEAGWALEQAVAKDASMRVRLQARSSLLQYQWAGYRAPKDGPPLIETKEPPLAPPLGKGPTPTPAPAPPPRIAPVPTPASLWGNRPAPVPPPTAPPDARPLPQGPLVPSDPPALQPAPAAPSRSGPVLEPPQ